MLRTPFWSSVVSNALSHARQPGKRASQRMFPQGLFQNLGEPLRQGTLGQFGRWERGDEYGWTRPATFAQAAKHLDAIALLQSKISNEAAGIPR